MKTLHTLVIEFKFNATNSRNKLILKFVRRGDRMNFIKEFIRLNELESVMKFKADSESLSTEILFNKSFNVVITKKR